jgi:hypothetical protein
VTPEADVAAIASIIGTIASTRRRKETAKVLLERDAGFFRDPGWVRIDGPEKILDLLLNFSLGLDLRTTWCGNLP